MTWTLDKEESKKGERKWVVETPLHDVVVRCQIPTEERADEWGFEGEERATYLAKKAEWTVSEYGGYCSTLAEGTRKDVRAYLASMQEAGERFKRAVMLADKHLTACVAVFEKNGIDLPDWVGKLNMSVRDCFEYKHTSEDYYPEVFDTVAKEFEIEPEDLSEKYR
jgi:hypothetical protein